MIHIGNAVLDVTIIKIEMIETLDEDRNPTRIDLLKTIVFGLSGVFDFETKKHQIQEFFLNGTKKNFVEDHHTSQNWHERKIIDPR